MDRADMQRALLLRRAVFVAIGLALLLPILFPVQIRGRHVADQVKLIYEKLETIPPGGAILVSFDFDPASKPELTPMARAVLRHAFKRNLRVVTMGLWITGTAMSEDIVKTTAAEYAKVPGRDYCFLGWVPGNTLVIIGMGQDLAKTFPKDFYGQPTTELKVMEGLKALADFQCVFSLSAGNPGLEQWVAFGQEKYGFHLTGGCTAVTAPGLYPFLGTGQIKGLLGGAKGGAEYEKLLQEQRGIDPGAGSATIMMVAISFAHFTLIALIIVGNVLDYRRRKAGIAA